MGLHFVLLWCSKASEEISSGVVSTLAMLGMVKSHCQAPILIFHSISHSPKGYTDQELGTQWLERDFHPASAERNKTGGYRLLILDGHNSHTTYKFCSFAETHKIVVVCLPSHTTHRLQPCDVGVFGPLASCWKAVVNANSTQYVAIRKNNLLQYYATAREKAFSPKTIQAAFRKTGIWPLNPEAIEASAFSPALNTTTKPALPLVTEAPAPVVKLAMEIPPPLPYATTRDAILAENEKLRGLLEDARYQMEKDHALKALMNDENGRLRERLFNKAKKNPKKTTNALARHLTGSEALHELARSEWLMAMKEVWKDPVFKQRKNAIERHEQQAVQLRKEEERLRIKEQKRMEREEKKWAKAAEAVDKRAATAAAKSRKRPATGVRSGAGRRAGGRRAAVTCEDSDEDLEDWPSDDNHDSHEVNSVTLPVSDAPASREQQDAKQNKRGGEELHVGEPRRSRRIGTRKDQPNWRELREQELI